LKSPTDALNYAIMYFEYQEDLFNNTIPKSTNLGLLELDSTVTRDFLTPVPKQMIKDIEDVVPVVIRERVDEAKNWLQTCIRNLSKPATNVEEYVDQNTHLNYTQENFQAKRDGVDLCSQYMNIMAEFKIKTKKEDKDNLTEVIQLIQ